MASPAKITGILPDTLPEDFGEWDAAKPDPQATAMTEADEILFRSFRAEMAEPKPAKKKRPIIVATSAVLVVVLAATMIPVLSHRTAPSMKPVAASGSAITVIRPPEDPALTPTVPAPTQPGAAATDAQHSPGAAPPSDRKNAGPSQAQAQMMNDQLNAPARIHITAAPAEPASPPSSGFAAADMDGSANNNVIGSAFGSAKQLGVRAASPRLAVAAGIAFGLLIHKTPPVYPPIAKTARISGTVVLAVTISKTGTIENLRVVSGPAMLREAAVDAVRTWRCKPYTLNDQPTEIQTTINVMFSLTN
ncbi:MAG TPA: TonB family protein [Terracidiphilus sp.]|jgi:protein TonB